MGVYDSSTEDYGVHDPRCYFTIETIERVTVNNILNIIIIKLQENYK